MAATDIFTIRSYTIPEVVDRSEAFRLHPYNVHGTRLVFVCLALGQSSHLLGYVNPYSLDRTLSETFRVYVGSLSHMTNITTLTRICPHIPYPKLFAISQSFPRRFPSYSLAIP